MGELSNTNNIESELLQGMDNPVSARRFGAIQHAAKTLPEVQLESEKAKTGVSEAIKNLDRETKEMFPDSNEVVETKVSTDKKDDNVSKKQDEKIMDKKILGMNPLVFGLVLLGIGTASYLAYKKLNK